MSRSWSESVSERYQLRLPGDVHDWLDGERWRVPGGGEFDQPLSPENLLAPEPGLIWAGFMLPDTLPWIGNSYGDWLCLRIGPGGDILECLYWSHVGGDWLPYGRTLAEALLYDACRACEGRVATRLGAEPGAEANGQNPPLYPTCRASHFQDETPWDAHAAWGWRQLGLAEVEWIDTRRSAPTALRRRLATEGLARWAIARDSVLAHLGCGLRSRSDYRLAERLGIPWEPDFVRWMFDTAAIPTSERSRLTALFTASESELLDQNWLEAERLSLLVMAERADMGWAFDIAGWAAERRGEPHLAAQRYLAGIRASLFADHTVPFRTHWVGDRQAKFSAARLDQLRDLLPNQALRDPYLRLFLDADPTDADPRPIRDRVYRYWMELARSAELAGEPQLAYERYYAAGWDLGLERLELYAEVLAGLERSAHAIGATARARIARLQSELLVGG
ncbi:MAG: hypothetical protein ACKO38_18865 [Planctomycetota bacterium]